MSDQSNDPLLTSRFALALSFANAIHNKQIRFGGVPYVSHLMSVSALVLEYGGGETEAVAALLHDAAEDCGGKPMLEMVRAMFGEDVAAIVDSCTDTFDDPKPEWKPRKERYIAHLGEASTGAKLVAGCDKLHNLNTMIKDLRKHTSDDYWIRFNAGAVEQLWYFKACSEALADSAVGADLQQSYYQFEAILQVRGEL